MKCHSQKFLVKIYFWPQPRRIPVTGSVYIFLRQNCSTLTSELYILWLGDFSKMPSAPHSLRLVIRGHSVGTLASLWGYSGVILWALWNHFEGTLGSLWIYFWDWIGGTLRSFWGYPVGPLERGGLWGEPWRWLREYSMITSKVL